MRWLRAVAVVLAAVGLIFSPAPALASTVSTVKTDIDNAITALDTVTWKYGSCDTADSSNLAWGCSYTADALIRMFQTTGQMSYLDKAREWIQKTHANFADVDGDGFKEFGTTQYDAGVYTEYLVHDATLIFLWSKYALAVRTTPGVSQVHRQFADTLTAEVNNHLIPKWESKWDEAAGDYHEEKTTALILENNRYLTMARALSLAFVVSPTHQEYLLRADRLFARFKTQLESTSTGYHWKYSPAGSSEDMGHGSQDIYAAVLAQGLLGSFNSSEMNEFAKTFTERLWNKSLTSPAFRTNISGSGPYTTAAANLPFLYWSLLANWDRQVWQSLDAFNDLYPYSSSDPGMRLMFGAMHYQQHGAPGALGTAVPQPTGVIGNGQVTPILTWTPAVNATSYRVQVATSSAFTTVVLDRNRLDTNAMVARGLQPGTQYYWRVISTNALGSTTTSGSSSFVTPSATLTFRENDSYTGSTQGYWKKQVLINGVVAWERDVANAAEPSGAWYAHTVDLSPYLRSGMEATVQFRLLSALGVSNFGVDFGVDAVTVTGGAILNAGFEQGTAHWRRTASSAFTVSTPASGAHEGVKRLSIGYPNSTASSAGSSASASQTLRLGRPAATVSFALRDNIPAGPGGAWEKQVTLNDEVIWAADAASDGTGWVTTTLDISSALGSGTPALGFRLVPKQSVTTTSVASMDIDGVTTAGVASANGGFESTDAVWAGGESKSAFGQTYISDTPWSGAQAGRVSVPSGTAVVAGDYTAFSLPLLSSYRVHTLAFSHRDIYGASAPAGYWFKQVLVDGNVVWEKDLAHASEAADAWVRERVDLSPWTLGKSSVNVAVRVVSKAAVSSFAAIVDFDDIRLSERVVGGNGALTNSGFESGLSGWTSNSSGAFTQVATSSLPYAGTQSVRIQFPSATAGSAGVYGSVSQNLPLRTLWLSSADNVDQLRSDIYALKRVVVAGKVVWSADPGDDRYAPGVWVREVVDATPATAGSSSYSLAADLWCRTAWFDNPITAYVDELFLTGVSVTDPGMEAASGWTFTESKAAFGEAYVTGPAASGLKSIQFTVPSATAAVPTDYARASQTTGP